MSKLFDEAISKVTLDIKLFVENSFEIADQIHAILESKGKTQRDLAELLGKNESEISKWLTGAHNFTLKSISKIEAALGEKIITTPIQVRNDFLKRTASATKISETQSLFHVSVDDHSFNPIWAQFSSKWTLVEHEPTIKQTQAGENNYGMAA
jgi:transcriptional regulator with XRE-family HTH domain